MRFLIDEMFGPQVAILLTEAGHDGLHVAEAGLVGSPGVDVLARAVADDRVRVTENGQDLIPLLDQRCAAKSRGSDQHAHVGVAVGLHEPHQGR